MKASLSHLVFSMICLSSAAFAQGELFRDTSQPIDARVQDLISRLTLEEKAILLNHKSQQFTRYNIRSDQWNQCLNGVQWNRPTTLFPTCIALSATWNRDLVNQVAEVLSDEARGIYNGWHLDPNAPGEHKGLIYRAPVINIERNPYWGRNHEAWGEDPYLTGRMAVAYVRGLQGNDPKHLKIATTLKHFAVNNVETNRTGLNAIVSERMLREYYLPHFRDAVVEGGATSLMASYNGINGTPNNINHWLLTDVLKNDWKHQGFVVSDLGGVNTMVNGHFGQKMSYVDAVAKSVMAGCDFSDQEYETNIPAAVREGKLSEARLNDALTRVLRVRFRLGDFDPFESNPYSKISPQVVNSAAHRVLALKAAQQSVVLLQNRGNLLPLDKTKVRRLAVIGPLADRILTNNYNGTVGEAITPLQGLKNRVAPGTEIVTSRGCDVLESVSTQVDTEPGFSKGTSLKLNARQPGDFIEFSLAVPVGGEYQIKLTTRTYESRGIYQLSIDEKPQGKATDFYEAQGKFGQIVSFGSKNLSAGIHKVRFTVTEKNSASSSYSAHFDQIILSGPREITLEADSLKFVTGSQNSSNFEQAVTAAKGADAAIVFVGTDDRVEQEGRDRKTLSLTGKQEELIKAVRAVNPRTIVIEMSAGPLTVPWLKSNVPALLQAWWPGEEGGNAIADVLFGMVNPAGRLPHTVYASESQVPSQDEYDISKGYTYMYLKGAPLFAFGHGLSYTKFDYSNLRLSQKAVKATGEVMVQVDIKNSGQREGDEVVQLYTHAVSPSVSRPALELRGFQRITLQPGEKQTVTLPLPAEKLAFWDEKSHSFKVETGRYEVMVGASSADIRHRTLFQIVP